MSDEAVTTRSTPPRPEVLTDAGGWVVPCAACPSPRRGHLWYRLRGDPAVYLAPPDRWRAPSRERHTEQRQGELFGSR